MNWTRILFLLIAAFLAVFWQAAFGGIRWLTGAQVDLLPGIVVYAALTGNIFEVSVLAVVAGTWLDSLSANPLGISILPLFAIGLVILVASELILKDETFAQFMFGLIASAMAPLLTMLLMLTAGYAPLLGWGTVWQWFVMSLLGAAATPFWFGVFDWLDRNFAHSQTTTSSFRPDREIRRGRM